MAITVEQAKNLQIGQVIYYLGARNRDGSLVRFRVNGKVQTWKTRPNDIRVPLKHGLYDYGELANYNLADFSLTEEIV